jgi:stage II sporulation protein AA (anti-sigma F factor antagonist)
MIELKAHVDGDQVLKPNGNLDWIGATALRHVVDDLLALRLNFVIDLSRTSGVDAAGVSALVGTVRRARALGAKVTIVNPRPSIRRRLELIGVDQLVLCSSGDLGTDAC